MKVILPILMYGGEKETEIETEELKLVRHIVYKFDMIYKEKLDNGVTVTCLHCSGAEFYTNVPIKILEQAIDRSMLGVTVDLWTEYKDYAPQELN